MQQKTNDLNANGGCLGLKISKTRKAIRLPVREFTIEAVTVCIYLGSKMQADGDSEPYVRRGIFKDAQPQHQDPYL